VAGTFLIEKWGGWPVNEIVWFDMVFLNHVFVVAQIVKVGRLHVSFFACSATAALAAHHCRFLGVDSSEMLAALSTHHSLLNYQFGGILTEFYLT
jgi:hypothetical protein